MPYNLLSLLLGFCALLAPVLGTVFGRRHTDAHLAGALSLALCGGAMLCQFADNLRYARAEDAAALFDTAQGRLVMSGMLLLGVLLLNLWAVWASRTAWEA